MVAISGSTAERDRAGLPDNTASPLAAATLTATSNSVGLVDFGVASS